MRSAIAAAGKDGVASLGDGMARLFGRVGLAPRGFGRCLDSGLAQHGQCRFHVRQPPRTAPARERVVEESGLAHERLERGTTEIRSKRNENHMDCTGSPPASGDALRR